MKTRNEKAMARTMAMVALWAAAAAMALGAGAAEHYDPLTDPACRVVTPKIAEAKADGQWMWYPGQLQAYRQAQILAVSKARCVNVDYPSRYNPKAAVAYFRTKKAIGKVHAQGDVETREADGWKVLKVDGKGKMPAVMAEGTKPEDWETSLDGKNWNLTESDASFCYAGIAPDEWRPAVVEIPSVKRIETSEKEWIEDFRHIASGAVKFRASGKGRLRLTAGETVLEARCGNASVHEQYPIPEIEVDGEDCEIEAPERVMRYLRFEVTEGSVKTKECRLVAKREDVTRAFEFKSDDETLNKLFEVGVGTLIGSMSHGFHIDGLKRDFLPWSMDSMLSTLGATWCCENRQIVRNDLSIGIMPPEPRVEDWACVDYPLHAIFGLETDYLKYRDLSVFKMFRGRLEEQLKLYEANMDERGFVPATRKAFFGYLPSWARYNGPENYGTPAYAQMLLYMNYLGYARFYGRLGEELKAAEFEGKATRLGMNIKKHFWSEEKRAFVNGYRENGTLDERVCHHSQYWAVLAGLYPAEHYEALFSEVLPKVPRYVTDVSYEKGYELCAYVKAGRAKEFYERFLLGVWKDWLEQGHTAFPEQFNIGLEAREQICFYGRPYGRSLCHGTTGLVPALFALRGALGFEEGEAAGEYRFAPKFVGKATRYEAKLRVKEGEIRIVAEKGGEVKVEAPAGVKVTTKRTNLNGGVWRDDKGVQINAHGGGILRHGGRYWWFGEHKGFDKEGHKAKVGVHVYSSENLADWRDEGIALAVVDDPKSDIKRGNTIERPKVVYSEKTGKFAMFFHLEIDGQGYSAARTGIAVADRVQGPYRLVRSLRPLAKQWPMDVPERNRTAKTLEKLTDQLDVRTYRESSYNVMPMFGNHFEGGQMARDQTLFRDDDGKTYHIYASEGNATLQVAELTEDCLDYTGKFVRLFPAGFNEAPAICKHNGTYYMIASDCTGWAPNACRYYTAKSIWGPWQEWGNPCFGTNPGTGMGPEKTWGGQSTFILRVEGEEPRYIAMFDEWRPKALGDSRYYWVPVKFTGDGRMELHWQSEAAAE